MTHGSGPTVGRKQRRLRVRRSGVASIQDVVMLFTLWRLVWGQFMLLLCCWHCRMLFMQPQCANSAFFRNRDVVWKHFIALSHVVHVAAVCD